MEQLAGGLDDLVPRTSDARDKIIEAACELFHQRGYQAVGVQEICDAAGVKKGSFYHFFRSKQELAVAMLDRMWEQVQEQEIGPAFDPALPPLQRIARYLEGAPRAFDAMRTPDGMLCGCPFGNMAVEMSTQDETIRRKLDLIYRAWTAIFETTLDEAIARGELPAVDTRSAAYSLLAFIQGLAIMAKARNSMRGSDELRDQALRIIHPSLPERLPPTPRPAARPEVQLAG